MQKEHMEIILEDIRGKFELVLEGHAVLRQEIQDTRQELNEKIEMNSFLIKALNKKIDEVDNRLDKKIDSLDNKLSKKIDAVADDLKAHRTDTESHKKGYRVSEA